MSSEEKESGGLLLGSTDVGPLRVPAELVATGRTCVIGSSGSGKSYAVGVLCEELCRDGVPFCIIDTEGEYSGIKEKFEAIWVGEEPGCDLAWEGLDLADLAKQAPDISPLILDVSDLPDPKEKVAEFLTALYATLTERRTPYLVVVEEADKFVPQAGERIPIFGEVARRGRKRGMGMMICTQRPSLVDKNVLSQCANQLIGKLIIQNDLQSVAQFFPGRGLPKELTSLSSGRFFAMGGFSEVPKLVAVRSRITRHGGVTPALVKRVIHKYVSGGAKGVPAAGTAPAGEERANGNASMGIEPSIWADDISGFVRRERSFGIFGPKETVTKVEAQFRTLVQVGVRVRKGVLRRRFETAYVMLDGLTGKRVQVNKGLEAKKGFERLIGLSALQVEVLREVAPDSDTSALDIASGVGIPGTTVSRLLNLLNQKRLVRTVELGRKKLYRRLVDLPEEPSDIAGLEVGQVKVGDAAVQPASFDEEALREVVKGLWQGSDLASFETLLYPVFKVDLALRRKRRHVLVDGKTGKELSL
ncbi:MAG: DUF87 domain-containing protein [archaeon]|nr:MAG: DUF87 domain-containing protein [archaeon]